MRIKKANAVFKCPVDKLNRTEYIYHDTNQTDMTVNCVNIGREEESLNIANTNLLIRFDKTREIFPSVTRAISILLTTAATSAYIE